MADKSEPKKPRGMRGLSAALTGRTDALAAGSRDDEDTPTVAVIVATEPVEPPALPADEAADEVGEGQEEQPGPTAEVHQLRPTASPPTATAPVTPAPAKKPTTRPRKRGKLPRPQHGPDGRLEASGEQVVKTTIEVAAPLLHALAVWERDETKRVGQRVFRERVVDLALDLLPAELDAVLAEVRAMPDELRQTDGAIFSSRLRASVRDKLVGLKPELRVAGIKGVRMRDIHSAALWRYLTGIGVEVTVPSADDSGT